MVTAAARLFRAQGYPATGWRQVVTESAAPWGSRAHHFPGGKEQLGVEALSWAATGFERAIRTVFAGVHPADAVQRWVHAAAAELAASDWRDGCPVATVTLETAHSSDALGAACAEALGSWRAALADALAGRGLPGTQARSLATLVLAGIEGALILARAERAGGRRARTGRGVAGPDPRLSPPYTRVSTVLPSGAAKASIASSKLATVTVTKLGSNPDPSASSTAGSTARACTRPVRNVSPREYIASNGSATSVAPAAPNVQPGAATAARCRRRES
jgi:AcrR family transcriptional regulator